MRGRGPNQGRPPLGPALPALQLRRRATHMARAVCARRGAEGFPRFPVTDVHVSRGHIRSAGFTATPGVPELVPGAEGVEPPSG